MQAAIGSAQMDKLDGFIQARKRNFEYLYLGLSPFEKYFSLPVATSKSDPAWFGFLMTVRERMGFGRNDLARFLEDNMIETRNLFAGNLIRQPAFQRIKYRRADSLENTDYIMSNAFFIGTYPGMNKEKMDYIIDKFNDFLKDR
jgi:CDP-6-deoxy-D-xylo-4-hexulose-3-dehydrase